MINNLNLLYQLLVLKALQPKATLDTAEWPLLPNLLQMIKYVDLLVVKFQSVANNINKVKRSSYVNA